MLDSKNILFDIGRSSTQDSAGLSEKVQDIAADSPNGFSAVFGHAAATLKAAESGNALPPSLDDKNPADQTHSREPLLVSRTLKGGISLIVGGDEPTDEGLVAFARAQGMDPDMLGLMSKQSGETDKPRVPAQAPGADAVAAEINPTDSRGHTLSGSVDQRFVNALDSSAGLKVDVSVSQATPAQTAHQVNNKPQSPSARLGSKSVFEINSAGIHSQSARPMPEVAKSAAPATVQVASASTDHRVVSAPDSTAVEAPQPSPRRLQSEQLSPAIKAIDHRVVSAPDSTAVEAPQPSPRRLQSEQLSPAIKAMKNMPTEMIGAEHRSKKIADQAAQPIARHSQADSERHQNIARQQPITMPLQAAALGEQTDALRHRPVTETSPAAVQRVEKNLHIKTETQTVSAKLSAKGEAAGTSPSPAAGNKLALEPKVAEAFITLAKNRQHLPATKVEPIILQTDRAAPIPAPATAPIIAAGAVAAPAFIDGAAVVNNSVTLAEQMVDRQPEDLRQDVLRRQDDYMQLSRQLADALGKRLTAQIQQGSWRVEMDLHPKTLGRIEVQLEMKNGEIEARFIAANAVTRDLINEGMPRLREAFQEYGTETAYVDVDTANQGFSDGKSTASESSDKDSEDTLTAAPDNLEGATENRHTGPGSEEDGLDILV